jgi:hypothetical protein
LPLPRGHFAAHGDDIRNATIQALAGEGNLMRNALAEGSAGRPVRVVLDAARLARAVPPWSASQRATA